MRFVICFGLALFAALPAQAQPAQAPPAQARPVVVELFTSEACSSCPPAEALLAQLKGDPNILPLAFHVTYWNGPAWTDGFSLEAATDRQSFYAGVQHSQDVYTPEAVVDGTSGMVGSNRAAVLAAIQAAEASAAPAVPVHVSGGAMLTVSVGAGSGTGTIWLFGFDGMHTTRIGGGENGGATIKEVNVVRSITNLGGWTGTAMSYTMPKPAGEHMAVLLQQADGTVLGAAAD
jgi:hypothetical protein